MRRRRRRIWLLVYLVLLLTSTIVRHSIPPATLPDGMRTVSLRTVDSHLAASGQINLAFVDTAPDSTSMPVVLVHGSAGSSHIFQAVTAGLSGHARVIVPDLPDYGASTTRSRTTHFARTPSSCLSCSMPCRVQYGWRGHTLARRFGQRPKSGKRDTSRGVEIGPGPMMSLASSSGNRLMSQRETAH